MLFVSKSSFFEIFFEIFWRLTNRICTYTICTMLDLRNIVGFEWDKGNTEKSYKKHGIRPREAEELFLDEHVLLIEDARHSQKEKRFIAIGKIEQKLLFSIFTLRNSMIRIISVRKANNKERRRYEEET